MKLHIDVWVLFPCVLFTEKLLCDFAVAEKEQAAVRLSKITEWVWRKGSVVKNTWCSCRGPKFHSQHLYQVAHNHL